MTGSQLWFSLSNVNSWHTNNIDFNYNKFDCTILDFFELPCGPVAKKYTDSLLATWNKLMFGHAETTSEPRCSGTSVAKVAARCTIPYHLAMSHQQSILTGSL